jgi:hypothetical protein
MRYQLWSLLSVWKNTGDNQLSSSLGTIFCWVGERIFDWQVSVLSLVVEGVAAVGMEQLEDDEIPMRHRTEQRQNVSSQLHFPAAVEGKRSWIDSASGLGVS